MGLVQLLSTLALVSVAGLILPYPCDAALADGTVVSLETSQAPDSPHWTVEPLIQDPADTSDDDDDDPDAQQDASSAIGTGRAFAPGFDSSWRLARGDAPLTASRSLEGRYVRGPPSLVQEPCDLDDDGDDDHSPDHTSFLLSPLVRASLAAFHQQPHVRARVYDGPRLRAP